MAQGNEQTISRGTVAPGEDWGAIVIVARNNLHLTKLTTRSALEQDMPCDVFVVDNASTDGTRPWLLAKTAVHATLCLKQKSLATCWNSGLRSVYRTHSHALVLNNDVEIRPDTYRSLLAHGGQFVTGVSVGTRPEMRDGQAPTSLSPHPDFSCFLIRRDCYHLVGPFNEEYWPAYAEDQEYHLRMYRAGIRAVSIDLPFLHHRGSTMKNCTAAERVVIERGAEANRQRFKQTYGVYPGTPEYEKLFT